jgi:plasmid stabilization system protein ParE
VNVAWTDRATEDLARLHRFLAPVNPASAARTIQALVRAGGRLGAVPRLGERLDRYDPREVRRLAVGAYELRYEVRPERVVVLRVWHARERR